MEFLKRVYPVLFAAVIAVSCASEETESYEDKEKRSFEMWISATVPNAVKHENGMYYEWIERGGAEAEAPEWGDYLEISYRGLLLSGYDPDRDYPIEPGEEDDEEPDNTTPIKSSVFMTRYKSDAKRLGTFTSYTHYVPQLIIHSRTNYLMGGMRSALRMMKTGDKIRLFLPSTLAGPTTSLTMAYGYGGNASLPSVPVIVELELNGIDKQPQTREEKFVIEYAEDKWGQGLNDTIREYVYYRVTEPHGSYKPEKVAPDSTAKIYYAAFFGYDLQGKPAAEKDYEYLSNNGFLIETNIEDLALKFDRDVSTTATVSFRPSSPPTTPTAAALGAISQVFLTEEIYYGSKFEILTTSSYAYGSAGQTPTASGITEVLPYQPIYIYVEVEKKYEDPNGGS